MVQLTIYVVKPGDSIYSIAKSIGVTPENLIAANKLKNPSQLVVGQALVTPQAETLSYKVAAGDTIYSLARKYGVSQNSIFSANPSIGPTGRLYPGQTIIIPQAATEKLGTIEVNGYIFPGSNEQIVRNELPLLTYLSIFGYKTSADGNLSTINDDKWITLARQNHVAPIMVVTNIQPSNGFSSDIAHSVLTNEQARQNLINSITSTLKAKNYHGLNIDFEYIIPEDRESYNSFLKEITQKLNPLGYIVLTALAPKRSAAQRGLLYEAHDYPFHGATANRVILMTYEWGYLAGPPQAVAPLNEVERILDYAVSVIPSNKILMGIPNYGYDWTLPYVRGTKAVTFSNIEAVNRAFNNNVYIRYDAAARSPYYNYYDAQKRQHIVWFEDARSIREKLLLVNHYKLAGISYWTADLPFPQNYFVLNSMYNVKKVI